MSKKDQRRYQFQSEQTKAIPLQYGDNPAHPGVIKGSLVPQTVCAYCGLGDFCQGCVDSAKGHAVQNKYVMDHNHLCCKKGCEKCWRGLVHDFCNKTCINTLDDLKKNGKLDSNGQLVQSVVDYLDKGNP